MSLDRSRAPVLAPCHCLSFPPQCLFSWSHLMQAEIKIPPSCKCCLCSLCYPSNPGLPPDFLHWFHSITSPHTVPRFCCSALLCFPPSFFSGFGLCFAEGPGKYHSEEAPALLSFFSPELWMSMQQPLLLCALIFSSLPIERRSLAAALWMLRCP